MGRFYSCLVILTLLHVLTTASLCGHFSARSGENSRHEFLYDVMDILAGPFIQEYGEETAKQIQYEKLLFSPKGRFLAVAISQITHGSPQQVWIMDIKTKSCFPVFDDSFVDRVHFDVNKDIYWTSEEFIVVNYSPPRGALTIRASNHEMTATQPRPESLSPSGEYQYADSVISPSGKYEIDFKAPATQFILLRSNRRVLKTFSDQYWWNIRWMNDSIFLFITRIPHGDLLLFKGMVDPKVETKELAEAGWELNDYAISPFEPKVAFAKGRTILIYDLRTDTVVDTLPVVPAFRQQITWDTRNRLLFTSQSCDEKVEFSKVIDPALFKQNPKLCLYQLK